MTRRGGGRSDEAGSGPLARAGLGLVLLLAGACSTMGPGAQEYPTLAEYQGAEVNALKFVAPAPYSADTLATLVQTQTTHCNLFGLGFCFPFTSWGRTEAHLDLNTVREDVGRLELFYRRNGFFGTRVIPDVEDRGGDNEVAVVFNILRGDSIILDSLSIDGVAEVLDTAHLRRAMPLKRGGLFDLDRFILSADTMLAELYSSGYANAQVLRNYTVDTVANVARVSIEGVPGAQVRVDSIVVQGAGHLGRRGTIRQLLFHKGDLLQPTELTESQRNLYSLDLVQFATVSVAPDSMQLDPSNDSTATILVNVAEGPVYVVDAAAGYGTVDCLRARTQWTSRSFLGGARRLVLSGSLSKIGIGAPLDLGLDNSLCPAFRNDAFANKLDYRLAADLTQPYFISPRNRLNGTVFAERTSEPNLFQRQSYGGDFTTTRQLNARDIAAFVVHGEYLRTLASPAVFCFALAICQRETTRGLDAFHWQNSLGATYNRDRTDRPLSPTSGYVARASTEYSPTWMGSRVQFVRGTAEGAAYFSPRKDWVLATRLRVGDFFGTADVVPDSTRSVSDLLPPEQRFYAGGANSVRGYGRNGLGPTSNPGVYVAEGAKPDTTRPGDPLVPTGAVVFVPLGGASIVLANTELRMPSPFLSRLLRLAFFVDVGALGTGSVTAISPGDLRVTPGFGLRFQTPVGPARLDVGYRPYGTYEAPVLAPYTPEGSDEAQLIRLPDQYQPDDNWLSRFQFNFAVGQPF